MNDYLAAALIVLLLVMYGLALSSTEEQQRAFEDELLRDHER